MRLIFRKHISRGVMELINSLPSFAIEKQIAFLPIKLGISNNFPLLLVVEYVKCVQFIYTVTWFELA